MRFFPKPARPIRDALMVYQSLKARPVDKKTGRILVDAREIANQTKITAAAVTTALDALATEGLIESESSPFTLLPCCYVTLTEDLEQAMSLRDRYDA